MDDNVNLNTLISLPYQLAICKLTVAGIPSWAEPSSFLAYTNIPGDISLVCEQKLVPHNIKKEGEWGAIGFAQSLDFSLTGIIAKMATILAKEDISVFVISTYNTDYILVKNEHIKQATVILCKAGYYFTNDAHP